MDGAFKMIDIRIYYEKRVTDLFFFFLLFMIERSFLISFISFYILTESLRGNSSKTNMIALISKAIRDHVN